MTARHRAQVRFHPRGDGQQPLQTNCPLSSTAATAGAFAQGTKAITGGSVGNCFRLRRQRLWPHCPDCQRMNSIRMEGNKIIGGEEIENSLFTHFLIQGMEGEADKDGDGQSPSTSYTITRTYRSSSARQSKRQASGLTNSKGKSFWFKACIQNTSNRGTTLQGVGRGIGRLPYFGA